MNLINRRVIASGIALITFSHFAFAGAGFATRDLNPMLQPIYLPAHAPFSDQDGWRIDHSFYVTNTLQDQSSGSENLVIDVENYRYELGLRYRNDNLITRINIPFIDNSGGQLDGLIENWHDFFGLSNGKRDNYPEDDINIEYQRDGVVEYSQTSPSSGLGDISLALGHQSAGEPGYFVGIELPTGSESDFSGNEAVDLSIWIEHEKQVDAETIIYGLIGLSLPGDDGNLEGLIVDQIWVAQLGAAYRYNSDIEATVQFDLHSQTIDDSDLEAFGESVQIQIGLGFLKLIEDHRLDLFFSEDILVGSAPDISFGARLIREF